MMGLDTMTHADGPCDARLPALLSFLQEAERLKDTHRSALTREGRAESAAEHSWRLCLMVCLFEKELPDIDMLKLLKLCLVHDLGEAISGDIPAPLQTAGVERQVRERRDMVHLCAPLPADVQTTVLDLWDEYAAAQTPEAILAKGFDKIETMLQHLIGRNPPDFDYAFNLTYGKAATDQHPLLRQLRTLVDAETADRASG